MTQVVYTIKVSVTSSLELIYYGLLHSISPRSEWSRVILTYLKFGGKGLAPGNSTGASHSAMRRGVGELKSQPGRFHGELCDVLRAVDGDEPLSPLSGPPVNLASQFKSPTKGSPIKTGESSPAKRPLPPLPPGAERTTSPEHISTPLYAALPRPHGEPLTPSTICPIRQLRM